MQLFRVQRLFEHFIYPTFCAFIGMDLIQARRIVSPGPCILQTAAALSNIATRTYHHVPSSTWHEVQDRNWDIQSGHMLTKSTYAWIAIKCTCPIFSSKIWLTCLFLSSLIFGFYFNSALYSDQSTVTIQLYLQVKTIQGECGRRLIPSCAWIPLIYALSNCLMGSLSTSWICLSPRLVHLAGHHPHIFTSSSYSVQQTKIDWA